MDAVTSEGWVKAVDNGTIIGKFAFDEADSSGFLAKKL